MRRTLAALFFATLFVAPSVLAYTSPGEPSDYVNDFAQVLRPETVQTLNTELAAFDATTTSQISVAIIPSLEDEYIESYAVKLFEEWKVGTTKNNNGVLLVIAITERKLRIEVGYGLEGALPDSLAQRILDNEMTPFLKNGDYDGAVTAGVRAIEQATRGEYTASATPSVSGSQLLSWIMPEGWFLLFIGGFILEWLASILGRSKSWWAGGIVGAIAGGSIGLIVASSVLPAILAAGVLGIIGLIFDYLVSTSYRSSMSRGSTPPWWTGGGGFSSGRSGGGFGGFGGGRSGGGGASGGW